MRNKIRFMLLLLLATISLCGCINKNAGGRDTAVSCYISIDCELLLENKESLSETLLEIVPENGIILEKTAVSVEEGESVYDVLTKACKENNILMEASFTAGTGTAYIEGIGNIYEFDAGELSGWIYSVNGKQPGVGCSDIEIKDGDVIEWKYSLELGEDLK